MLFPWLSIFDFGTFRANFKKSVELNEIHSKSENFAVLIPIFNNTRYLTNIDFLKRYSKQVVLCTTTNETEEFISKLKSLSKRYGFRISFSDIGKGVKNPWAIYNKTLLAHDSVLKESIRGLKEKYVIFIDGDTIVDGDLKELVGAVEENNFDLSSVRILPGKRVTLAEKMQGVEYDIAMQARLIYPWLTSGAGMVAKREVMIEIMKNHSLFFNGGDIEIGKLADMMGYKVGHVPMVFYTDIPETFKRWSKQRFSWMCGCFRHSIMNARHNLNYPFHFIYFTFIIYFLLPIKLYEMFLHLCSIPIIIFIYALLTYIANWKVRSVWMLLFPFYALFQVTVLLWCGIYRYITTVNKTKNFGFIRVVNNPNNVSWKQPKYAIKTAYNFSIIAIVIGVILIATNNTLQDLFLGEAFDLETTMRDLLENSFRKDITFNFSVVK